jgi:hypothetical protein
MKNAEGGMGQRDNSGSVARTGGLKSKRAESKTPLLRVGPHFPDSPLWGEHPIAERAKRAETSAILNTKTMGGETSPNTPATLILAFVVFLVLVLGSNTARATVITWTNAGGGNWSVYSNWSPNLVPGSTDDAYIGNYTVSLDESAIVAGFTLDGGTLNGSSSFSLTVNSSFTWSGGLINTAGGVMLSDTCTSLLNGVGNNSMILGDNYGGWLINAGSLTWSGSGANLYISALRNTITNLASGTINIMADVSSSGGGIIVNAGLLTKTGGTNTTTINAEFINSSNGTVEVQSGTVSMNGGGTEAGIVTIADGATLNFGGLTHSVVAGFSATGPGILGISAGEVDFNEPDGSTVSNLVVTGGTLGGTDSLTVGNSFTCSGGTIDNSGGVTLNGTSSLNGVGNDSMTLSGNALLINAGELTWSGSGTNLYFYGSESKTFTNLASGTITITADVSSDNSWNGGHIGNAGLLIKSGTPGTSTLYANFVNTGTVEVQSGTINLAGTYGDSTEAGIITNASGATFNFSGATHTVLAGFSATGPGTLMISGGEVDFNSLTASPVSNLTLTGTGTLGGSGLLAVNGPFTWSGGTINNSGGVTLNGTSSLNGVGNDAMTLSGNALLINAGELTWSGSGSNLEFYGSESRTFTNLASGTITITADVSSDYAYTSGTIGNAGLMTKTGTTGTTTLNSGFVNTGTLNVQSGTISLTGGYYSYTSIKGTLAFGISGATNYGKINFSVAPSPSFKSSLGVNLNGSYWPTVGSSFNLLTYPSGSGVLFTNTALPPFITWQTNYNSTVFTLTVSARQTNAAPTNLTMSLGGNTSLSLAWPGDHTGWQLEAQTNSNPAGLSTNWVIVPGSGLTNEVTFPISLANGSVFFRLLYP